MALRDYRLCDVCGRKTFYDANLDVSAVGALVVLCQECAKTHSLHIYARDEADCGFDGKAFVDLMGLSQRLRARAVDAETEVANLQRKLETTNNGLLYALRGQAEHNKARQDAEAALAGRDKPCVWRVHLAYRRKYESGCTGDWWERKFLYCPNCGHPICVQP